jgi:alkanesulfonate monooxygenase SsuD/methylene tetrahydromethanopterin reductase-like flavin-dependent oxidoreductase (luciferase family)
VTPGRPPLWIGAAHPKARARAVRRPRRLPGGAAGGVGAGRIPVQVVRRGSGAAGRGTAAARGDARDLVGDSAADAIKRHQPFIDEVYPRQYKPERIGLSYVDKTTKERKPLTSDNPYFMSEEFMQDRWLLGTPAEIAKKLIEWQKRLGMDHLIFTPRPPGMPLKQAVDELTAIAREVLPAVKAI